MGKVIRYQKISKMEPRDGFAYATSYLKQTLEQRQELVKHIRNCIGEVADCIQADDDWREFIEVPLKGFKTTTGANRSMVDVMHDMLNEANGRRKQSGIPKDFAMAPIDRWNRLFEGTDYEIVLIQTFDTHNNFSNIAEVNQ